MSNEKDTTHHVSESESAKVSQDTAVSARKGESDGERNSSPGDNDRKSADAGNFSESGSSDSSGSDGRSDKDTVRQELDDATADAADDVQQYQERYVAPKGED